MAHKFLLFTPMSNPGMTLDIDDVPVVCCSTITYVRISTLVNTGVENNGLTYCMLYIWLSLCHCISA